MYSDVLPTTEVDVMQGLVSRMHCVLLCARKSSCQTIFYKSSESKCFLYKYPMLERTPVNPEMGTDVYEMQGMLYLLREKLRNDKGIYYVIQENALTVIALIKKWRVLRNVFVCLFVCFVVFRTTRELFTHIESSQLPLQELQIVEICSALMAILQ